MCPVLDVLHTRLSDPLVAGLSGRFHTHLTVADGAGLVEVCTPLGARVTLIDLADFGSRAQRDVMVTVDHHEPEPGALARVAARLVEMVTALEAAGFPVVRLKIEHGSLPTTPAFDRTHYREAHLKLAVPSAEHPAVMARLHAHQPAWGYAPSRNPREQRGDTVIQFVNLRMYHGDLSATDARIDALVTWLTAEGLPPVDVRRETAIVDTAQELDAWWA